MAKILIIDDEALIRKFLRQTFEEASYEVAEASNGNEGMAHFRENPANLVITDLIMPDKEGLETIMELRQDFPKVKIIAMSGDGVRGQGQYLEMAKKFGANRTFVKPFKRRHMLAAVKELLA